MGKKDDLPVPTGEKAGRGTELILERRSEESQSSMGDLLSSNCDNSKSQLRPSSILVVEDDPPNQRVLLLMLRHLGYRTDAVNNGLEALQALQGRPYDLVLMDLLMPEMDGLAAAREIRRRWPERKLKIIALTAYIMPNGKKICFEAGIDDYILKPIRIQDLARLLEEHIPKL